MLGRDAGEDGGAFGDLGQVSVGDLLQFAAGEGDELPVRFAALEPNLHGDGPGGDEMIARNHLHGDAGALAFAHGGDRGGTRGIHHCLQPEEGEASADMGVFEFGVICLHLPAGEGQHAQSTRGHRFGGAMHRVPVERDPLAAFAEGVGAAFEQAFERADFVDHAAAARVVQRGAEHMLRLKRNHIHLRRLAVHFKVEHAALLGGDEQRGFGRFAPRLDPAVLAHELGIVAENPGTEALGERRMFRQVHDRAVEPQVADGFVTRAGDGVELSARIDFLHGHLILGECAGLVRADYGRAAERFDRRQLADDRLPLRHPRHPDGEHDGNGSGQTLGDRADRDRHRGHEHAGRCFTARHADGEGDRRKRENGSEGQVAELGDFSGERGGQLDRAGNEPPDAPGFRLVADGPDDAFGHAARDERAGISQILPFGENRVERERVGVLGHRERLAGEGGFIHLQIADVEQPEVGGHAVAGLQKHHIARNELLGGDALVATVAPHGGFGGDHSGERLDGFFRLRLLQETNDRVDEHDAEDDRRVHPFAQERRDADGQHQDVNERLVELPEELGPRRRAAPRRDAVGAPLLLTAANFIGGQAGGQFHVEELQGVLRRQLVPWRDGGRRWPRRS